MRNSLVWMGAAIVGLLGCSHTYGTGGGGGGGGSCTPTATQVCMSASKFNPTTLTITHGTMVTWKNADSIYHTVTSGSGSTDTYDSSNVPEGSTYSRIFSSVGTYDYYCKFHGVNGTPPTGMHGTITVN